MSLLRRRMMMQTMKEGERMGKWVYEGTATGREMKLRLSKPAKRVRIIGILSTKAGAGIGGFRTSTDCDRIYDAGYYLLFGQSVTENRGFMILELEIAECAGKNVLFSNALVQPKSNGVNMQNTYAGVIESAVQEIVSVSVSETNVQFSDSCEIKVERWEE